MSEKTLIISGVRPTFQLHGALKKHFNVAVFDQASAQALHAQTGEGVICPVNGAGDALFAKARHDAAMLTARTVNALPSLAFSMNGVKPSPAAEWLPSMALGYLPDVVMHLRILDAYAETTDVAGVVTHEDLTPRFRALALWGKARGLPVIHVPHANCFGQARPDIHDESVSDWILATSPYMRDWYAARGFSKEHIKVVGFGPWDAWKKIEIEKDFARRLLQLDEETPTVTLCTGWAQRTNIVDDHEMVDAAVNVALASAAREGWQVVWKLHPGDRQGQEMRMCKLMASHRVRGLVTRDHLALTMAAGDAVLSVGPSNVLIEAALVNRPPALFNLRGYGFDGEPPWVVAPDLDDMAGLLDRIGGWDEQRERFVQRYAYRNDGKATARTVRAIRRIING